LEHVLVDFPDGQSRNVPPKRWLKLGNVGRCGELSLICGDATSFFRLLAAFRPAIRRDFTDNRHDLAGMGENSPHPLFTETLLEGDALFLAATR